MPPNPYSQNSNNAYNDYTPGGYEKAKLRKLLLITVGVLAAITIIVLAIHFSQPESQQSKYQKSATAAARKQLPNAEARNIKVAGGFAFATVNDPTAQGQLKAGNATFFKVNADGSMTQLISGSSFTPIDLLNLGIPLAIQAKLAGSSEAQVKQNLANLCGYEGGGVPGYSGFDGSFSPGGWEIDSATLSGLEQALSDTISSKNAGANLGEAVICVEATQKNSNATTDTNTYISTFTLQVQYVTNGGTLTVHRVTFATGPNYYRNYTLDGHDIQ